MSYKNEQDDDKSDNNSIDITGNNDKPSTANHTRSIKPHQTNGTEQDSQLSNTGNSRMKKLENNLLKKRVSDFIPKEFDICLLLSYPLMIKKRINYRNYNRNKQMRMSTLTAYNNSKNKGFNKKEEEEVLEYIYHSLPDRIELQQTVRETLMRCNIRMRFAHFTSTYESIKKLSSCGGCKVLQFVGYCCNPKHDKNEYPELCKSLYLNGYGENDTDYILLETEVGHQSDDGIVCCFGKGIWCTVNEFYEMLNSNKTAIDCIIAISPQHNRLTKIFETLGYKYIIGIQAPNNDHPFCMTETHAFLDQFYAALLQQRSVSRAYYLSLQAALTSRGGHDNNDNDNDPKYILQINQEYRNRERFVIFNDEQLKNGPIDNKSQYQTLPKTNIYLREPVRPFIGRSEDVMLLINKLTETQIINITGKELIGRASVVKSATRYLLQMGFFRGGCYIFDCKLQSKKYQQPNKSFNECVYDVLKSCGLQFDQYIDGSLEKLGDPKTSILSLFAHLENSTFHDQKPPSHEPFCFVILNINHWYKGGDYVCEWIKTFSQQLFKKEEDSRIICTGKDSLSISAVFTLNTPPLKDFDRSQLARLFKHFCGNFSSLFDPSQQDIEKHDELQKIFDGRPGMTKKVATYVGYLFAKNAIKDENDEKDEQKTTISLDEIAKNYPTSKFGSAKFQEIDGLTDYSLEYYPTPYRTSSVLIESNHSSTSQQIQYPTPIGYNNNNNNNKEKTMINSINNNSDASIPTNSKYKSQNKAEVLRNLNKSLSKIETVETIGINHSELARKIWLNSCLSDNIKIALLNDLYPSLMEEFKFLTKCDIRQPTLQQIEVFFVRIGGAYDMNIHKTSPYIRADKFDKFFVWFRSMCCIIKDLRPIYNQLEDPLIALFYARTTAQEILQNKPEGTFILRLASQQNGLAITYKNPSNKIQSILLTRISDEMYKVGKSDKETLLFQLIRPWPKLKYLYTPNKLIQKKFLF